MSKSGVRRGLPMINLQRLLAVLAEHEVDFVIVGGVAASLHGSAYATFDLDVCYSREAANLARLATALSPFDPTLRDAPAGLPFVWDHQTLRSGSNFTLHTDLGDIDLFAELPGIGGFPEADGASVFVNLFGKHFKVLSLDALIISKRVAGRPKDFLVIPELEALRKAGEGSAE